jgi:hypothetical protein
MHYAVYETSSRSVTGEMHPTREAAELAIERLVDGLPAGSDGQAQRQALNWVLVEVPEAK